MSRIDTSSEGGSDFSAPSPASRSTASDLAASASPPRRCDTSSDPDSSPPTHYKAGSQAKGRAKALGKAKGKAEPKAKAQTKAKAQASATATAKSVRKVHLKAAPASGASCLAIACSHDAESEDVSATESEDEFLPSPSIAALGRSARNVPASSGVADYVEWVVAHILSDAERKGLSKSISVGSMCAGMGMEEVALAFLRQALLKYNIHLEAKASFKAEKDPAKMAFLQRQFSAKATEYFNDNLSLAKVPTLNATGFPVKQPVVDVLLCGIVCKDISQLNNKPKSERDNGVSGGSLNGLLAYIASLSLELRPKLVLLECVQRLGHSRAVDPDSRRGTEYIADELASLGYVWALVPRTKAMHCLTCRCATNPALPSACTDLTKPTLSLTNCARWVRGATSPR